MRGRRGALLGDPQGVEVKTLICPQVIAATRLDLWLGSGHPCRGAGAAERFPSVLSAEHPGGVPFSWPGGRGTKCRRPRVSCDTPYLSDPDRASVPLAITILSDPYRGRGVRRISLFPGSLGLRPSDHRATKDAPLRGALPASPFRRILVRHPRGVAGLFCDT